MKKQIRYKPLSEGMKSLVEPTARSTSRASVGLEDVVKEYLFINVDNIIPYKHQARKLFDEEEIGKLADSIRQYGVRQPLTIVKSDTEISKFEVVSGERRLRAAIKVGLKKVPCILIDNSSHKTEAIALIENIHRADLNPVELGEAYKTLLDKGVFKSITELSTSISETTSSVSENISLAELPNEYKTKIIKQRLFSRDNLRAINNAYKQKDFAKLKKLLGENYKTPKSSFAVLRIMKTENGFNFQSNGLKKITSEEKQEIKKQILDLLSQYE